MKLTSPELLTVLAILELAGKKALPLKELEKTEVYKAELAKTKSGKKKPVLLAKAAAKAARQIVAAVESKKQDDRLTKGMKIVEWIARGEFEEHEHTKGVLQEAGVMLEGHEAWNITGDNLMLCSDGRYYEANVRVTLNEASDEHVAYVRQKLEAEADQRTIADAAAAEREGVTVLQGSAADEALAADKAELEARIAADKVTELLDRVETQAVRGADELGAQYALEESARIDAAVAKLDPRAVSEQAITIAGIATGHPVGIQEIKEALAEYGTWTTGDLAREIAKLQEDRAPLQGIGLDVVERRIQWCLIVQSVNAWITGEPKGQENAGNHIVPEPEVGGTGS